jgi:hypothetical protein
MKVIDILYSEQCLENQQSGKLIQISKNNFTIKI